MINSFERQYAFSALKIYRKKTTLFVYDNRPGTKRLRKKVFGVRFDCTRFKHKNLPCDAHDLKYTFENVVFWKRGDELNIYSTATISQHRILYTQNHYINIKMVNVHLFPLEVYTLNVPQTYDIHRHTVNRPPGHTERWESMYSVCLRL